LDELLASPANGSPWGKTISQQALVRSLFHFSEHRTKEGSAQKDAKIAKTRRRGAEAEAPARVRPAAAGWNKKLSEFILMYDAVRRSESPRDTLLEFLQSTYDAGARLAKWDPALEAPLTSQGGAR